MLINFVDATNDANRYTKPPRAGHDRKRCKTAGRIEVMFDGGGQTRVGPKNRVGLVYPSIQVWCHLVYATDQSVRADDMASSQILTQVIESPRMPQDWRYDKPI